MTGKLDEISRVIGGMEQKVGGLKESFDQHCLDDDRRHTENTHSLRGIEQAVSELTQTIKPLAKAVAAMQPVVEGYQITRWKIAGALGLAAVLVGSFGWLVLKLAGQALLWMGGFIFK
jgi:hypothetical protein